MEIIDNILLDHLRWNSYLSTRYKLLYIATPKVACTTLKWWFAALEGYSKALASTTDSGESSSELVIHDAFWKIAPNVTGLAPEKLAKPLTSDEYFRFAVVRNPYKRIFSAWQSKLLLREPLQSQPYLNCDFFHFPITNSRDICKAFEGFLEHLVSREMPHYWDVHWTPQASLLRPDLISYGKLVQIENVQDLKLALADHLGPAIPDPFAVRSMNESLIPYLPEFISERAEELIRLLYAQDFNLFKYERQKPEGKKKFTDEQLNIALKAINLIRDRHQRLAEIRIEHDHKIATLNQGLIDRASQIANLNQGLIDRDSQIADISQRLSYCDEKNIFLEKDNNAKRVAYCIGVEQYNQLKRSTAVRTINTAFQLFSKIPGAHSAYVKIRSFRENRLFAKQRQLIAASGLFDENYYLAFNPAVKKDGLDPITHFLIEGVISGCRPSPRFDPVFYRTQYPDVAASGVNPLLHYVLSGKQEGRITQAVMSSAPSRNISKERYTSNNTLIFVCLENSDEKKIRDFYAILRWFYIYSSLDIRVLFLGEWTEKSFENIFPSLVINTAVVSQIDLRKSIHEFAGNDIKAIYFNEISGISHFHEMTFEGTLSLCIFESENDDCTFLKSLDAASLDNKIKFIAFSESDSEWLNEKYNIDGKNIELLNITHHVVKNYEENSYINAYSERLLWCFREVAGVKPAVSVIIPNYNHAQFLEERLESVFSQTYRDIEVLLLDDSSTDNSLEILNEYARRYPSITKSYHNKINSGSVFKQWKKGIKNAAGELLWIAESDDVSEDSFLQQMLPQMKNSRVKLSYCQSYCMGGNKNDAMTYVDMGYYDFLGRDRWYRDFTVKSSQEITQFLAVFNTIPNVSSALIRNVGIDPLLDDALNLTVAGDWFFYIKHSEGGQIAYLAQPLNYHRCHCNSIVGSNRNELLFNEFKTMHLMVANRYQLSPEIKEKMCSYVQYFVWPGLHQKQTKCFEQLYDINLLKDVAPGKGSPVIRRVHSFVETDIKPIAFYLPQFHAIPENDAWWGKGFTEWTNTKRAKPLYTNHYQPRIPHKDLGYYDLSNWQVLEKQAVLAKQYGIYGFCFHHYWFDGTRLLEKPVDQFLEHPEINFPFCLCWANENWTRCWDGFNKDILKAQNHSPDDDLAFIQDLSRYLNDYRYIRVAGKPLVIIYRPELLPSPLESAKLWRDWCREHGIGEIYLAYVQGFANPEIPKDIGFDAKIEFPPLVPYNEDVFTTPIGLDANFKGLTLSYPAYMRQAVLQRKIKQPSYPLFRSVMMAWDNTARRNERATIFTDFSLQTFSEWLKDTVQHTRFEQAEDSRFFFINAWNEWAEGTYLEPDRRYGYGCLEAVRTALNECDSKLGELKDSTKSVVYVCHDAHLHGAQMLSLNIVREMKEHFGFQVYLILLGGGVLTEQFEKYATVFDFSLDITSENSQRDLLQEIRKLGVNIAYCSTVVSGSLVDVLKTTGYCVVTLVHELSSVIKSYGLEREASSIAQNSDKIIFPSQKVSLSFIASFPVSKDRYVVRPQGVFLDNPYKEDRPSAKDKVCSLLAIPNDSKIVLAVGYADLRKGVDIFVKVAKEVLGHTENTYFVWVGNREKELALWLQHDISIFGLEGKILFIDATDDIAHFYSAANVFVLPSREDPFPIVLLDAMAAGTPVVGFRDAGGFEDIVDGTNGVLVPYLDTKAMSLEICGLIENELKSLEMGISGKTTIETNFNFNSYVDFLLLSLENKINGCRA